MEHALSYTKALAFVGDYLPRRCGIATFTADLREAIAQEYPETTGLVAAVSDRPDAYAYPEPVEFEIEEAEAASYRRAADFLNLRNVDIVSVQHEFGIYGGAAGGHLLGLLKALEMPAVTTLHTVLAEPNGDQRRVMEQLDRLSARFVVMAERGRTLLEGVYNICPEKIDVIPHGISDEPFIDPHFYKDLFDAAGKTVLLTFGLLSPNKGIEHAIAALPTILEKHPDVIYLIVGATHPNLVAHEGEVYRRKLERLAAKLGVSGQVRFHNRFVSKKELAQFIGGADIYITPYLNEAQITSGTLSYAFGAGKAVISTPYWHAAELLGEERGILVPFSDSGAIAEAVNTFLCDPALMTARRKLAWEHGREMIWPVVARRYMESFAKARAGSAAASVAVRDLSPRSAKPPKLPPLRLDHLERISDGTGLLQHARYNTPNLDEGYCVDDNARGLILTTLLAESGEQVERAARLGNRYLAFLAHAFNPEAGRFRNFMSYDRRWLEAHGSEDSHARSLWAAGTVVGRSCDEGHRALCARLLRHGLAAVETFTSPRAWAFTLLAIHESLRRLSGDRQAAQMRETLTRRLVALYRANSGPEWKWFEPVASYDNARLSHALILSGYWTSQEEALRAGLESLRWLLENQTAPEGHFSPIGCCGFWKRGGAKARFDQQPVEAQATVSACLEAHRITGELHWLKAARRCFEWYLGRNDIGLPLYDAATGGCHDALMQDRLNRNQGAESTLACALSLTELRQIEAARLKPQTNTAAA